MIDIYVNFYGTAETTSAPWSYNSFGSVGTAIGQLSADLLDDSNSSTGYSLDVVTAFTGASGSGSGAISGAGGWPLEVFQYFYYTNTSSVLRLGGLTDGDNFTIELAGHQNGQPTRDTDFTIGATTVRYDNSGTTTPNAPISISGTVSGTTLDITLGVVSTFAYISGMKITITPSGLTIDSEPIESRVNSQSSFTVSNAATAPTTANTTIALEAGGPTIVPDSVTGTGPWVINYTPPKTLNKKFNATGYVHRITIDAETVDSSVIPYLPETNWDFVTVGTPDITTDIYTEYAGGTFVTGDQVVWNTVSSPSSAAVTIYDTLDASISPKPTVTNTVAIYRIAASGTKDADDVIFLETGPQVFDIIAYSMRQMARRALFHSRLILPTKGKKEQSIMNTAITTLGGAALVAPVDGVTPDPVYTGTQTIEEFNKRVLGMQGTTSASKAAEAIRAVLLAAGWTTS